MALEPRTLELVRGHRRYLIERNHPGLATGRAGTEVALREQDKHLHYSRGVTVEEMRQASMALMPVGP